MIEDPGIGQQASGNYIAQADRGGTASVSVFNYGDISPRPVEPAQLDAARQLLSEMPVDEVPEPTPTLPPGSAMPLSPNSLFVGREEELKALAANLKANATADAGPVVITVATGLGGVGKTQLASEFVHRYGQYFAGGVFWLSFADPSAIPAEVAACGGAGRMRLRPDFHALPFGDQVREVMSAWQSPIPRLLVFDNCEDERLLNQWRPPTGGCRVLVTSRRERWDRTLGLETLQLDVLSREESLALLRKHRTDLPEDDPDLDAIANELGDLPLALDLAGRYLERYRYVVTPAQYLDELRRPDLLKHRSLQEGGISPTGHEQNVARTFALSYERLDTADPSDSLAIALLHRAARFAPGEPIPHPLLLSTLHLSNDDPEARLRAEDALSKLAGLGLLETEEEATLRMHRLVAAFVRVVGDDEEAQAAVEARLIGSSALLFREGYFAVLLVWLPHLRAAAAAAEEREDARAALLYAQLGLCLYYSGAYSEAQVYLERTLSMRETVLGEEHPDTVSSLNNLANLLVKRGRYDEARPRLERALAIREKVLGPEHPDTAQSLTNLGRVLGVQGSYDEARPYFERALRVYERTLGEEHPDAVHTLANLASTLRDQGNSDGARRLYERALAIFERTRGEEHPFTASILDSLGNLLVAQGNYDEARPHLERALSTRTRILGENHPDTVQTLGNLANMFVVLGDYDEAQRLLERKLAINERVLGEEHPANAESLTNLAIILIEQGNFEGALPLHERALAIREKVLGEEHPATAESLTNLGNVLWLRGAYDEARDFFEQSLAVFERAYSEEHPVIALSLNNLANVLSDQGDFEQAQRLFERSLAIREKTLGSEHPDTAQSLYNLAVVLLRSQVDYDRARRLLERSLTIYETVLGANHPRTERVRQALSVLG